MKTEKYKKYAPVILRAGVALVFLWFGFTNIFTDKLAGYIPDFIISMNINASTVLLLNGIFEVIFGILLLLGLYTKLSSFLLGLHVLLIIPSIGYNAIAIRDIAIIIVCISIFLNGADRYSLDKKLKKPN